MRTLDDLPTPCLLLDLARLEANCARMRDIARRHGVRLRPHLKTCKSLEVARVAWGEDGARAGTVSTLEEAVYFAERGVTDLTYAVGIVPSKLDAVASFSRGAARLGIVTDDVGVARAIASHAGSFDVWIEVDSGQRRGGVSPEDPRLIELAETLASARRVRLCGVLTHAGQSYACTDRAALVAVAEAERASAVHAAERVRAAGIACPEVSIGSTPTITHAERLDGVTEVRPGVYVFGDRYQARLGSCAPDDIAVTVLASVVGRREDHAWLDAGALALSQDSSMREHGGGYGEVRDVALAALPSSPIVDHLNQVHGRVVGAASVLEGLAVGARVRVLPSHVCMTAAMFDRYHVVDGERVIAEWPRLRG